MRFWSINNQINAISGSGSPNMKYRGTMVIHGPYFVHIFCVQFLAGYSRTFSVWRQGMSSNMISERNQPRSLRCWRWALQRGQTEHDRTLQDRQNMTEPFNLRSYRIPVPQPHWIPRTCPNRTPQNGYYRVYRVLYHLVPRSNIKSARGPRHSWCGALHSAGASQCVERAPHPRVSGAKLFVDRGEAVVPQRQVGERSDVDPWCLIGECGSCS